jgi:hypothetical protein
VTKLPTILGLFLLLFSQQMAFSQAIRFGTYQSMKGLGVAMDVKDAHKGYHSFVLYADCCNVFYGTEKVPGFRTSYAYNIHFLGNSRNNGLNVSLFSGPGFTMGYVRDHGKDFGLMGGLFADAGINFNFPSRITLNLGWSAELGFHLKKGDNPDYNVMTIYKNGFYHCHYPELKIFYRF